MGEKKKKSYADRKFGASKFVRLVKLMGPRFVWHGVGSGDKIRTVSSTARIFALRSYFRGSE